jgi:hypothetical protein
MGITRPVHSDMTCSLFDDYIKTETHAEGKPRPPSITLTIKLCPQLSIATSGQLRAVFNKFAYGKNS